MSRLTDLIGEVHRRSLWQVLGIYLGASWVIFQGIQAIVEGLKLPDWIPGFAIVLMMIGLPVVLATAFVQEGVGPRESPERREAASPPSDSGDGIRRLFTWRNAIGGGVGAFALLGLAATGWMLVEGLSPELVEVESANHIRSIAVLPLKNLSGDPAQEYFVDGMTEALITDLAKIRMLRVISRTSVMRYKGSDQALPVIAGELGVQAILEGSVIREDDRLRITVQLIDAQSDSHLWAENYDREITGVLALQSEVARAVAERIEIELTPGEERQLSGSDKIDPKAYEAYLRGRFAWNQRSAKAFEEALRHFQAAIERDPKFALAYAGLAATYDLQGVFGHIPPREAVRGIRRAVMQALELEPELGEAHVSLADLHWWQWEWPEAERALRHALELNPSYATGYAWFSYLNLVQGREAESLDSIERALELDPLSAAVRGDAANIHFYARRFEEAIEHALAAIRLDPDLAISHSILSTIYSQQGHHPEAVAAGRQAVRLSGGSDYETCWLAYSLARAGARDEANLLVEDLVQRSQRRYVDSICLANAHAGLGNRDEIFVWLERAYREGPLWLTWINASPVYDEVRDDPRFQAILEGMGVAR